MLFSIAAGSQHPITPNLQFEYSDIEIHEDLHKLIKYSSEEVCTSKEQLNKVMKLWTTFLEPMLDVPSLPHGSESNEDSVITKHRNAKSNGGDAAALNNSKQSKAICNGDENTSPLNLINGDTLAKEEPKNNTSIMEKSSEFNRRVGSSERLTNSEANVAVGIDNNIHSRIGIEIASGL